MIAVWSTWWKQNGTAIKNSGKISISERTGADNYICIARAWHDGTLKDLYGDALTDMPRNIQKVVRAIRKHRRPGPSEAAKEKKRKMEESDQKLLDHLKRYKWVDLPKKLPCNQKQRALIYSLVQQCCDLNTTKLAQQKTLQEIQNELVNLKDEKENLYKSNCKYLAEMDELKKQNEKLQQDINKSKNTQ